MRDGGLQTRTADAAMNNLIFATDAGLAAVKMDAPSSCFVGRPRAAPDLIKRALGPRFPPDFEYETSKTCSPEKCSSHNT
jgi:hypothetical protein